MFKFLFKKKRKKSLVAVLDIGATKIICLIAYLKPDGALNVVGVGHCESSGFKSGVITNVKQAENSIVTAVEIAERMCGEEIDRVIVTLSSSTIHSSIINSELHLPGKKINERDINNLIRHTIANIDSEKEEIIHYAPIKYALDDVSGIENPVGLFGYKLSLDLQVITLPTSLVYNLVNCLADCHLDVEDIIISPFASSYACMTQDEKDLGAILVDMGGATTSFAVFAEGGLVYCGAIPLGGSSITSDIAKTLTISSKNAERIKTISGSAIVTFADNYKMIDLPVIGDQIDAQSSITNANLNNIIGARVEEIFEILFSALKKAKINESCIQRIVLTGGGSLMVGVKEFLMNNFKYKVRLSKSVMLDGLTGNEELATYASSIGALKYLSEKSYRNYLRMKSQSKNEENFYKQLSSWIKENF